MDSVEFLGLRVHDGDDQRPDQLVISMMHVLSEDEQQELGDINVRDLLGLPSSEQRRLVIEHRFEHYLSAVIARGLQLGISLASMGETLERVGRVTSSLKIEPVLPVIGFDVDDVFETIYEQDGEYLRVVENDYSERLSAEHLQQLMDERQR